MSTPILIKDFTAELVREYSMGRAVSLGTHQNRMRLFVDKAERGHIVWNYGSKTPDEHETVIGLIFAGTAVIDYDGVFELPREARALLIEAGFSLIPIGYDSVGNEII